MPAAAVVGIGAVAGAVISAKASSDAADKQSKAIKQSAQTVSAAASRARQDVLNEYTPALREYGKSIDGAISTLRDGTFNVIDTLSNTSNNVQELLTSAGADARKAILGSTAQAAGIPRQSFEAQYTRISALPPEQRDQAVANLTSAVADRAAATTGTSASQLLNRISPMLNLPGQIIDRITQRFDQQAAPTSTPTSPATVSMDRATIPRSEVTPAQTQPIGTGLYGAAEQINAGEARSLAALAGSTGIARGDVTAGRDAAINALTTGKTEALDRLSPYTDAGRAALDLEAALSGALGPEAQQAAFDNYIESPGQAYLRSQEEEALLRSAAATGGLGSGRTKTALLTQAKDIASTFFQQNLQNLQSLAMRGQEADTTGAGIIRDTASQISGVETNAAAQLATLASALGTNASSLINANSTQKAELAMQAGLSTAELDEAIAAAQAGSLADFGSKIASAQAGSLSDIANLEEAAATNTLTSRQQLATTLANIGTQSGTQVAELQASQGAALAAGQKASGEALASGIESLGKIAGYGIASKG